MGFGISSYTMHTASGAWTQEQEIVNIKIDFKSGCKAETKPVNVFCSPLLSQLSNILFCTKLYFHNDQEIKYKYLKANLF